MGGYFNAVGGTHRARVVRLLGKRVTPGYVEAAHLAFSQTARAGDSVLLPILTLPKWPVTYQWYKDGAMPANAIATGTNQALRLLNVSSNDSGDYTLKVGILGTEVSTVFTPVKLTVHAASDRAGMPDPDSFTEAGPDGPVRALLRLSNGQVVIAGTFTQVNGKTRPGLARLNPDGTVDDGFDLSGQLSGRAFCLSAENETNLLVGGTFVLSDGTLAHVVRIRPDNAVDPQFRIQANKDGAVRAVLAARDGTIFVGGDFNQVNGAARPNVAHLTSAGVLDSLFSSGVGPDGPIHALAEDNAGGIWLGGHFGHFNGQVRSGFVRVRSSGVVDPSFKPFDPTTGLVNSIAIRPDGRIVLGGRFSRSNGSSILALYQFNTDGSPDLLPWSVNLADPQDEVFSVAVTADNQLLLAGRFSGLVQGVDGLLRHGIARIGADGRFDRTFDPGAGIEGVGEDGVVYCMESESDGNVLIGGGFSFASGIPRAGVARIIGTNLPVSEIRRPPTFHYPPYYYDQRLTEDRALVMTNLLVDAPDSIPGALTFSLDSGAPDGMTIDPKSGILSWRPTEAQGGSTYSVSVRVSDNGNPPLSAVQTFSAIVYELNSPPHFDTVPPIRTMADELLTIQLTAFDPDLPKNPLRFWPGPGAPAGSTLDPSSGVFRWTPSAAQLGTNVLQVVVSDNAQPPALDSQWITIVVESAGKAPVLETQLRESTLTLWVNGVAGKRYGLEASSDLVHWIQINELEPGQTFQVPGITDLARAQFFRVREL
jgi:hypothetical protein